MNVRIGLPLVDPFNRFCLYTNAKCGGTSLKAWFFRNMRFYDRRMYIHLGYPRIPARMYLRLYSSRLFPLLVVRRERLSNADLRKLTRFYREEVSAAYIKDIAAPPFPGILVVRNPIDRIVSAYVDKFCGEDRDMDWVQEVVEAGGTGGEITFNQFVDFLANHYDDAMNPHWRRQTFVTDAVSIDHIVRLEEIDEQFSQLQTLVGTSRGTTPPRKRQSNIYGDDADLAQLDIPNRTNRYIFELGRQRGHFPAKRFFLDPASRERIASVYRRDMETFGY